MHLADIGSELYALMTDLRGKLTVGNRLKCNRSQPCENCVKRGDASSCTYAQAVSRKKNTQNPTNPDDMQNRIDRLESLVLSLMTNGSQSAGPSDAMAAIMGDSSAGSGRNTDEMGMVDDGQAGLEESDTEQVTKSFGILKVDNNKSYYISDSHWVTVLNDVSLFTLHVSFVFSDIAL